MKKTLVALAVLAASGASFAQVTITGEAAFGYQSTSNVKGVSGDDKSGMGTDTSEIYFGVKEDLGGGMAAEVVMQMGGLDRGGYGTPVTGDVGGAVLGKDFKIMLTTTVGKLTLGTVKASDYLSGGVAGLGTNWNNFDGKVFSGRTSRDVATFQAPVGPVTLSLSHQEPANNLGEGSGQVGSNGQRLNIVGVNYNSGAMVVDAQYLSFGEQGTTDATTKNQMRLSGNYDLGVVKLGAGVTVATQGGTGKVTDSLLAVKAPLGALTLGAQFANRNASDSATVYNGSVSGYALNAVYNLSKRTYLWGQFQRWDQTGAAAPAATTQQTTLLMVHDF